MTKFNIGDKVRYVGGGFFSSHTWKGVEGVVEKASPSELTVRITKETEASKNFDLTSNPERRFYPLEENLELIVDTAKFAVGDRVELTENYSEYLEGTRGTVIRVTESSSPKVTGAQHLIAVKTDDGDTTTVFDFRLKKVEAETFGFKDIKTGDKIKRTFTHDDGTIHILEGVVEGINSWNATAKDGVGLGWASDDRERRVTFELLERPKPKPEPKLWENRKVGDQIIRTQTDDKEVTIFTKTDEDEWNSIYLNNSNGKDIRPTRGYDWDSDDIGDALTNDDYDLLLLKA